MRLRTLGIDLAAQPKNTAACAVEWTAYGPRIREHKLCLDD